MPIPEAKELEQKVFAISNEKEFSAIALDVYNFQFCHNFIYRHYCKAIGKTPETVQKVEEIPFLPISFFKTHQVITTNFEPEITFKSSGTTGVSTSTHYVKDARLYIKSFSKSFERFYGNPQQYCILGLLPAYLERGNSSLVYMVDCLIKESLHPQSGFYLNEFEQLSEVLKSLEASNQKTILFGVTYALLDFGKAYAQHLTHTIIIETGGMKGRGKELTKVELYHELKSLFGVEHIHSEYGMTELLSQAYSIGGKFSAPPWMKFFLRDETDPFEIINSGKPASGAINVVDLANIYSCSFIATEDIGRTHADGSFEVVGRLDNSDIRGCSLLLVE